MIEASFRWKTSIPLLNWIWFLKWYTQTLTLKKGGAPRRLPQVSLFIFMIFQAAWRCWWRCFLCWLIFSILSLQTLQKPKVKKHNTKHSNQHFPHLSTPGLTAVETWVVSCILHVFGVLAEYALILKMIQVRTKHILNN